MKTMMGDGKKESFYAVEDGSDNICWNCGGSGHQALDC